MGMRIDDEIKVIIRNIEILKSYHNGFLGYVVNLQDSIDVAISTMRKYQMIEQIIDDWTKPKEIEWKIREVLEDGEV